MKLFAFPALFLLASHVSAATVPSCVNNTTPLSTWSRTGVAFGNGASSAGYTTAVLKSSLTNGVYYVLTVASGVTFDNIPWSVKVLTGESPVDFPSPYCFLTKYTGSVKTWTRAIPTNGIKAGFPLGNCQSAGLDAKDNLYVSGQTLFNKTVAFALAKYSISTTALTQVFQISVANDPSNGAAGFESSLVVVPTGVFVHTNDPSNTFQTRVSFVTESTDAKGIVSAKVARSWAGLGPAVVAKGSESQSQITTAVGAQMAYDSATGDLYVTMSTVGMVKGAKNLVYAGRKAQDTDRDCLVVKIAATKVAASAVSWVQAFNDTNSGKPADDICMGVSLIDGNIYLYGYSHSFPAGATGPLETGFIQKLSRTDGTVTKGWPRPTLIDNKRPAVINSVFPGAASTPWIVASATKPTGTGRNAIVSRLNQSTGATSTSLTVVDLDETGDLAGIPIATSSTTCGVVVAAFSVKDVANIVTDYERGILVTVEKK